MPQFDLADCLLGAETPSIRYLTATALLNRDESDAQVLSDRQAMKTDGPMPAIFAKQTASGQWAHDSNYYQPKYVSTHWSLMLLTELCVDPADTRFQRGVDHMLTATDEERLHWMSDDHGLSCFWGNLLRYALHAGRADDPRVQSIVDYVARDISNGHGLCRFNVGKSCAWGVVRGLWGLAALPPEYRGSSVQSAIEHALPFLQDTFSLLEANYPAPDNGKTHSLWFKLNFPLFYQVDILFTLRILGELGVVDHPGTAAALDWLEAQRLRNGRWRGRNLYGSRTWRELGGSAETARWVSLQSATILQQAGRLKFEMA